jgi:transposase
MPAHKPSAANNNSKPVAVLPSDVPTLQLMLVERDLMIEKLKLQIARMTRARFGASSEQLESQMLQLELIVEDLETSVGTLAGEPPTPEATLEPSLLAPQPLPLNDTPIETQTRSRAALPAHLPRERVRYTSAGACGCKHCGAHEAQLTHLGDDESELLEYVPGRFKVIVHVRPKYICGGCRAISQADALPRVLARSYAGPALLAHVLTAKYADHLPLYRQSEIYAREGVDLSRSTLADWVGGCSALLTPLVDALQRYVIDADKLHTDDTPVPVLQPGRGTTKMGRLWSYVRDDRNAPIQEDAQEAQQAPAVWFAYSPDRKGSHPQQHLQSFRGILQADAYAGFERLYEARDERGNPLIMEAACWAHARRKFFEIHTAAGTTKANPHSPPHTAAGEVLRQIGALYAVEQTIRGKPPDERSRIRQLHSRPKLDELKAFLQRTLAQVSRKSNLAAAIGYALTRWTALTRFVDDGRIEIDNK